MIRDTSRAAVVIWCGGISGKCRRLIATVESTVAGGFEVVSEHDWRRTRTPVPDSIDGEVPVWPCEPHFTRITLDDGLKVPLFRAMPCSVFADKLKTYMHEGKQPNAVWVPRRRDGAQA